MKVQKACRFRRSIRLERILHKDLFYRYADMPKKMDKGARPLILRCTLSWSAQHVQSHFCRTVFGSNRNKIEDIHGSFFWFLKSSEDCCIRTLRLPDFWRIVFRSNRFMQIFLRLQNFAPYQNFRVPTILVKRFSGEKQNLSPALLIQIEGQEEQQEKGAAGRAAGGKEKQEIEEEQNDPNTEY